MNSIKEGSFAVCELESFPKNVYLIGKHAFYSCFFMKKLIFLGVREPKIDENAFF